MDRRPSFLTPEFQIESTLRAARRSLIRGMYISGISTLATLFSGFALVEALLNRPIDVSRIGAVILPMAGETLGIAGLSMGLSTTVRAHAEITAATTAKLLREVISPTRLS